jgi:alpha-glucuronidase
MDRTVATGTGYAGQYRPEVARIYESVERTSDDLLLFFHHVPYSYTLHSGKTVIQYLYDSHYAGAEAVTQYVRDWKSLQGRIDDRRFAEVLDQLEYQEGAAQVWRDAVTSWFLHTSGIADVKGRVGRSPGRFEAESMKLEGYTVNTPTPWESASGGKVVECAAAKCTAGFRYQGAPGWYTLHVRYFDLPAGASQFSLRVAGQIVDRWTAGDRLPARKIDGASSTRRTIHGIALRPGDEVQVEGVPEGPEAAALDYIEIHPGETGSGAPQLKLH